MALGPILPALWTSTPRIVVPFAAGFLRDETRAAVPYAKFVQMVDDQSYWRLLCRYWKLGQTFIIVEHDISPTRAQIDTLWACPQEWCAYEYQKNGMTITALGCTKFDSALLGRTVGLPDAILDTHRHWQSLDAMIVSELHRRGAKEHVHQPAVLHLHEPQETKPRRYELTRLKFIGDGTKYLNGIPADDFETWDAETTAICIESGLYEDVTVERPRRGRPPNVAKVEQPDYVVKYIPFSDDPTRGLVHEGEIIIPANQVPLALPETSTEKTKE
jgi:hypothetical protein